MFSDEMWAVVEPLLPPRQGNGRPFNDHRKTIEGICWRLRTGCPWRDLPDEFGPWQSLWRRYDTWAKDGTWDKLLRLIASRAETEEPLVTAVDGTIVKAHKHAAGAQKGGWIELQECLGGAR